MKPVGIGVIGAGGIADKRMMPGILQSELAELVAFAETNGERRKELACKYNVPAYESDDDLLRDDRVECVYIASPLRFHYEQALKVIESGRSMLLEKPLALTAAQAHQIAVAARQHGCIAASGFMMRFHVIHQTMHELAASGCIGDILSCRAQFGGWSIQTNNKWRHNRNQGGGGSLMDMGIHAIDLIRYISGLEVKSVTSLNSTLAHTFEVEDTSGVLMCLEGGRIGYVDSYFSMPTDHSMLEINGTHAILIAENTLSQVESGTLKIIKGNGLSEEEKTMLDEKLASIRLPNDGSYSCYTKEIDDLCKAIRTGTKVQVSLEEAVAAQRIVETAYAADREKRFIDVKTDEICE